MPAPSSVVVLGAGISGLAGGLLLSRQGHDVTIIEARPKPGGRILTLHDGFSSGVYAEAGATFLHMHHSVARDFVSQLGLETLAIDLSALPTLYLLKGKRIVFPPPPGSSVKWPYPLTPQEQKLGPKGLAEKYTLPATNMPPIDPYAPGWPPDDITKFDRQSLADLMFARKASPGAVEFLSTGLNSLTGFGPESYSALLTLAENRFLCHYGKALRIKDGNDRFPIAMAKRLAGRIHYGAWVRKISQYDGGVSVSVEQNGKISQVEKSLCLCTIPFSVLRNIPFEPHLSPAKAAAVSTFPYTMVTRIFCEFERCFWSDDWGLSGLSITDLPVMVTYSDFGSFPPRGILQVYAAGQRAVELAALSHAQREKFALDEFEKVFPGYPRKLFVGSVSKSWGTDPCSLGGYPWFLPDQVTRFLEPAIAPHGRVHFAGDHCSVLPGWIEGALRSALHAVEGMTGVNLAPPATIC